MMQIIICSASSISRHPAQLSLLCGGLREKYERTEEGTNRTHGQLYARSLMAARARSCERRTEKLKQ